MFPKFLKKKKKKTFHCPKLRTGRKRAGISSKLIMLKSALPVVPGILSAPRNTKFPE